MFDRAAFRWTLVLCLEAGLFAGAAMAQTATGPASAPMAGLSLFFQNSSMRPFLVVRGPTRFLDEIDVVATTPATTTDEGLTPLMTNSEMARLDWTGVSLAEEVIVPNGDGTFKRERQYRNAAWMDNANSFSVAMLDVHGNKVGATLAANAGTDAGKIEPESSGGWVRRFNARQVANPCTSPTDCTGATYFTQGLAQWRHNLQPRESAAPIAPQATALQLSWNQDPGHPRTVAIDQAPAQSFRFGYGFALKLTAVTPPANNSFYQAGDTVRFRVDFLDGQGRSIYPAGVLPTYADFRAGPNRGGLQYYDPSLNVLMYYDLKHREGNIIVGLVGPSYAIHTPHSLLNGSKLFVDSPQTMSLANDGFSGTFTGVPSFAVSLGGFKDSKIWDIPVANTVDLAIPKDALAGTYVAVVKARRIFGGQAINAAATTTIQVGSPVATGYTATTGGCAVCHNRQAGFQNILHGVTDFRACATCHMSLSFEPDNALDIRVHAVHDRSRRTGENPANCSMCHLAAPTGPGRGFLQRAGQRAAGITEPRTHP